MFSHQLPPSLQSSSSPPNSPTPIPPLYFLRFKTRYRKELEIDMVTEVEIELKIDIQGSYILGTIKLVVIWGIFK